MVVLELHSSVKLKLQVSVNVTVRPRYNAIGYNADPAITRFFSSFYFLPRTQKMTIDHAETIKFEIKTSYFTI